MRATKLALPVVLALLLGLLAPSATAAEELPVAKNLLPGIAQQLQHPDTPPPGANDWACKPTAKHPNPVVLAHGLLANQTVNWQTFAPLLHNEGYCVYTLTYGKQDGVGLPGVYEPGGMVRMEQSAEEFAAFVDKVLTSTGAAKVDILGHSEGTVMPSYYVRFLGGGDKVGRYVSLTPLWKGTTLGGLSHLLLFARLLGVPTDDLLGPLCGSCSQFLQGSEFLKKMQAKGQFDPRVKYTNIVTRYDEAVVPYTSGLAAGPNITNIVLQERCVLDFSEHLGVAYSPNATQHVLNALDPANATRPVCKLTTPITAP